MSADGCSILCTRRSKRRRRSSRAEGARGAVQRGAPPSNGRDSHNPVATRGSDARADRRAIGSLRVSEVRAQGSRRHSHPLHKCPRMHHSSHFCISLAVESAPTAGGSSGTDFAGREQLPPAPGASRTGRCSEPSGVGGMGGWVCGVCTPRGPRQGRPRAATCSRVFGNLSVH